MGSFEEDRCPNRCEETKVHPAKQPVNLWAGEAQTCSLVSRSHQRCGRINVPNAAMAQIIASKTKLAMRKNPPFMSCIERGTTIHPTCSNCTTSISLPTATTTP